MASVLSIPTKLEECAECFKLLTVGCFLQGGMSPALFSDDDHMPTDDDQNVDGNNDSTAEEDSNDGASDDNSDESGEVFINFDDVSCLAVL